MPLLRGEKKKTYLRYGNFSGLIRKDVKGFIQRGVLKSKVLNSVRVFYQPLEENVCIYLTSAEKALKHSFLP